MKLITTFFVCFFITLASAQDTTLITKDTIKITKKTNTIITEKTLVISVKTMKEFDIEDYNKSILLKLISKVRQKPKRC